MILLNGPVVWLLFTPVIQKPGYVLMNSMHCAMEDPGFPRGGCQPQSNEHQLVLQKIAWEWKKIDWEGALGTLADLSLVYCCCVNDATS